MDLKKIRTFYRRGAMNEWVKEMEKHKLDICTLQEISWPGRGTVIKENYMLLYSEHKSNRHESGTEYYVSRHIMNNLLDSEPVNETICIIRFKLKYYILTLISTHTPIGE